MQRLNLGRNQLTKIPHQAIAGLTYLETLELSDNPITDIKPGEFNGTVYYLHWEAKRAVKIEFSRV